jgi:DNA (cytosine-5)-methyltransferase 1
LANSDSNARESRRARYAGEGASGWDSNRGNIGENMADAEGIGTGEQADAANAVAGSRPAWSQPGGGGWWAAEPDVGRVADGVSARAHRLRLLGNSVVPQQAALAWSTLIARSARR